MSRESVLARGRVAAGKGMVDTCVITRVTGTTTNPVTGAVSDVTTEIYEGPCKVQEVGSFSRDADPSPDQNQQARHRSLHLPVETSLGVRVGDRVEITLCVHDPDLEGLAQVVPVRDESGKSFATARRLGLEWITG